MTVLDRGSVEDQLKAAPTSNEKVLSFVRSVAELATPDRIEWVTGDRSQRQEIADALVAAGTLIKLDKQKDSYKKLLDQVNGQD